eukprot:2515609-Prymnesium_polylepis.2
MYTETTLPPHTLCTPFYVCAATHPLHTIVRIIRQALKAERWRSVALADPNAIIPIPEGSSPATVCEPSRATEWTTIDCHLHLLGTAELPPAHAFSTPSPVLTSRCHRQQW